MKQNRSPEKLYASYIKRCKTESRPFVSFEQWEINHEKYVSDYAVKRGRPARVGVGERIPCLGPCGGMITTLDKKTHRMCDYCASRRH